MMFQSLISLFIVHIPSADHVVFGLNENWIAKQKQVSFDLTGTKELLERKRLTIMNLRMSSVQQLCLFYFIAVIADKHISL